MREAAEERGTGEGGGGGPYSLYGGRGGVEGGRGGVEGGRGGGHLLGAGHPPQGDQDMTRMVPCTRSRTTLDPRAENWDPRF